MPNILHLSAPDIQNASGVIAYDLHKGLSDEMNSTLVVRESTTANAGCNVISYLDIVGKNSFCHKIFRKVIRRILNLFIKTDPNYYFVIKDGSIINVKKLLELVPKPDVIIAYFMQDFFSIKTLHDLQKETGAPILFVFPDMEGFTGGCHYAWDCIGYEDGCVNCPAISNSLFKNIARRRLENNRELVQQMDIIPITVSYQLNEQVKVSKVFGEKRNEHILLGMDESVYYDKSTSCLRDTYDLPQDKFIILFGAVNHAEKRKGIKYLNEALELLACQLDSVDDILLLCIGGNYVDPTHRFSIRNMGYVRGADSLSDMYNVADVFVVPSIQDSGPSMINQSVACGTPVVSFDVGVSKDLIFDGETGYVAPLYDSFSLATGIKKIYQLNEEQYSGVRSNCLRITAQKSSLTQQVSSFREVIDGILES